MHHLYFTGITYVWLCHHICYTYVHRCHRCFTGITYVWSAIQMLNTCLRYFIVITDILQSSHIFNSHHKCFTRITCVWSTIQMLNASHKYFIVIRYVLQVSHMFHTCYIYFAGMIFFHLRHRYFTGVTCVTDASAFTGFQDFKTFFFIFCWKTVISATIV
jgi:hypothetical protein